MGLYASPGSGRSAVASYNFGVDQLAEVLMKGNWRGPQIVFKNYLRMVDLLKLSKSLVSAGFKPL